MFRRTILSVVLVTMFLAGVAQAGEQKPAAATEQPVRKGPKQRLAVVDFESKVSYADWKIGQGMSEMLVTELSKTDRFIIVERQALDKIIQEQNLAKEGRINKDTAARIGNLIGAQVLVSGAITEFESSKSTTGTGLAIGGIGLGGGKQKAVVGMDVRLYDSTTGQILQSHSVRQEAESTAFVVGGSVGGVGFGTANFQKTPLGEAARKAIAQVVGFVVAQMKDRPWEGRIVMVKDGSIYVNAGSDAGIAVGDTFTVFKPGEELVDPATGISLGFEETRIGVIRVVKVNEKFSVAEVESGKGYERNFILKYNTPVKETPK